MENILSARVSRSDAGAALVYGLSLCSGIGGLDLGLRLVIPGYSTVCYVEIETFCQDILLARMADGILERAPIWSDLKSFDARPWNGLVDVVHGGYPCQPFSVAGKRAGAADPRHIWPDVARIVGECEPEWCFFENVAGHLTLGFDRVVCDLEYRGYEVAAGLFTAAEVGAPHKRQRLFILAHADCARRANGERVSRPETPGRRIAAADFDSQPSQRPTESRKECVPWPTEPGVGRVVHGVPRQMDRLKALGNAVVPGVAALAWRTLIRELT